MSETNERCPAPGINGNDVIARRRQTDRLVCLCSLHRCDSNCIVARSGQLSASREQLMTTNERCLHDRVTGLSYAFRINSNDKQ